jgi:hypothetical protein
MAARDIEQEHAPVLTVTEARQGRRGRHMAWVLGISMALVVMGLGGLWLAQAPSLSGPGGQTSLSPSVEQDQARAFQAPPSPARQSP